VAHEHGAWVHVDGAFGLWAAASPRLRHLVAGHETADSWATDAHKTLNVPYDCGIVVARRPALRAADGYARQLPGAGRRRPGRLVPELSRRARGVPVWAALRSLGRTGVADLVDRLAANARAIAAGIASVPARRCSTTWCSPRSVPRSGRRATRAVTARLLADGVTWMSGSRWRGRT
jgi:glutamate/tyrosine decarboxylase-like PLP-dependent enzyme